MLPKVAVWRSFFTFFSELGSTLPTSALYCGVALSHSSTNPVAQAVKSGHRSPMGPVGVEPTLPLAGKADFKSAASADSATSPGLRSRHCIACALLAVALPREHVMHALTSRWNRPAQPTPPTQRRLRHVLGHFQFVICSLASDGLAMVSMRAHEDLARTHIGLSSGLRIRLETC